MAALLPKTIDYRMSLISDDHVRRSAKKLSEAQTTKERITALEECFDTVPRLVDSKQGDVFWKSALETRMDEAIFQIVHESGHESDLVSLPMRKEWAYN